MFYLPSPLFSCRRSCLGQQFIHQKLEPGWMNDDIDRLRKTNSRLHKPTIQTIIVIIIIASTSTSSSLNWSEANLNARASRQAGILNKWNEYEKTII
ncbi:hypothetical protein [Phaffia rhodozyma]|uniref:Uncharacterized protein n=1 Tax=Phaffia rhodozyma TaxID=264483 RepID=A0A0F7SLM1_PHARH|nr:hypothetical protein [Phaffia rhodozyma]